MFLMGRDMIEKISYMTPDITMLLYKLELLSTLIFMSIIDFLIKLLMGQYMIEKISYMTPDIIINKGDERRKLPL